MSLNEEGREGEAWCRTWLKDRGFHIFQADWIARGPDGNHIVVEMKHQEHFTAPPFDGHGLPPQQVFSRMNFYRDTGVRTKLVVREKGGTEVYWQWLDVLEAGAYFDTRGKKPRRVYPLTAFDTESRPAGGDENQTRLDI